MLVDELHGVFSFLARCERFLQLREKRYLPAAYAHLMSLAQIERLMTLKQERSAAALPAA